MKAQTAERDAAITQLLEWVKPGDTVYTVLRHVSRGGMQREIGLVLLSPGTDGRPVDLHPNYIVAKVLGLTLAKHGDAVNISGTGRDKGFEIVYNLGAALWPNGYTCTGEGCQSNDHSNGDRNYAPHLHRDGGYALAPRWL